MIHEIEVENIKCDGCINSIKSKLLNLFGVQNVSVDLEHERVTIESTSIEDSAYIETLSSMGYPPKGQNNLFKKAHSFVSCAIGKINHDN